MKIFPTKDIAKIDQYTIEKEPISDIDLMERASLTVVDYIVNSTYIKGKIAVFCGPGNNGGDGLAVARLLAQIEERFQVSAFIHSFDKELKGSSLTNLNRLIKQQKVNIQYLNEENQLPVLESFALIIDALFGSGLNRPLDGFSAKVVNFINDQQADVLSIDIPSGLMGENNGSYESIIKANKTITFQFPKLSFMFPENENYVGDWIITDIGLHKNAIEGFPSKFNILDDIFIKSLIKKRTKFSHKGSFGHSLLISGSYGKMGAAILASKACLRSGTGLLTTHIPRTGYQIIQTAVPEAMVSTDDSDLMFTDINLSSKIDAIGIGPGIGQKVNTQRGLKRLIENLKTPSVFDADALNILSENKEWIDLLPENSILTPHPKEFERLTKINESGYAAMDTAMNFARKHKLIIVLKGAHTIIVDTEGSVWFNTTGNPGMATAGSGDVLTGIILGLLAQSYKAIDAARIGVYIHGLAGDIAAARHGNESLIASDIVDNLGEAFKIVHK